MRAGILLLFCLVVTSCNKEQQAELRQRADKLVEDSACSSQPTYEQLGYSGSERLHLKELVGHEYDVFSSSLLSTGKIDLLPATRLEQDPVFRRIIQEQPTESARL